MPAFSPREVTHRAEHEAHVAELQRSRWRVGVVEGRWRLAEHDGTGWRTWDESIPHDSDADFVGHRYALMQWLRPLLGYGSAAFDLDWPAQADGRMAFTLTIMS